MTTKQLLGGELAGNTHATSTLYFSFLYGPVGSGPTLYSYTSDVVPTAGVLSGLTIILAAAPGVGKSFAFTVMVNGAATDISITISGTDTQGQDLIHSAALSAGDYVNLRCVPSGTPTVSAAKNVIVWTPTIDGEYILGGNSSGNSVGAVYIAIPSIQYNATEANVLAVVPLAGTVKKLAFQAQLAPGAGKSVVCTSRKNGADQSLVATVAGATDTQNIDAANSFAVVEGDLICAKISTTGGAINYRNSWACVLVPSTIANIPMMGSFSIALSTSTQYGRILGPQAISGTSTAYTIPWYVDYNFSKIVVYLSAAPGEGKSRTITLRDDDADTGLAVTVSGTDQTGSASAAVSPADLSLLNFKSVATDTPAAALLRLGFVYSASSAAAPYDDGTSDGGIVFGGEVVEVVTLDAVDGDSIGGIVFGGDEVSSDELHQVDGPASGGIVFGGDDSTERWVSEPNNWVAVKGGTYRISGVIYTLPVTMSYEGLGDIAALVNCNVAPAVAGTYRYDLLSVDTTGAITVTAGAEAAVPVMPTTPAASVKLNHVLRYYGQTSIIQGDIGKTWLAPALATIEAAIADDELAWAELSTTITITCRDQYGQLFTGSKTVNATFESGNGTITPLLRSGGGSSFVFTYTRGGNDPGDVSPMLTFSSPTGALCVAFITLLDAGGSIMI